MAVAVAITKKPTAKVTGLGAPTRADNSAMMQSKWNVPASATKDTNAARIQGLIERWTPTFRDLKTGATRKVDFTKKGSTPGLTQGSFNLSNFNGWKGSDGRNYALSGLYPQSGTLLLDSMTAQIRTWNDKGVGDWVTATRKFYPPKPPTMSDPVQNAETGVVSVTVKPADNKAYNHRHDTLYRRRVYDSRTGETTATTPTATTTGSEFTLSYDVDDRMLLTYEQYVQVTFEAKSRGFAGASSIVTKTLYVSWPNKPTILGVDVPTSVDGKVTVRTDLNATTEHPTTHVQLEKLVDVAYTSAADIPGTAAWEACGAVDDGQCKALSATMAEVNPSVGTHTWIRLKVWNQIEGIFYRYSDPIELSELFREVGASAGGATILSAIPGTDGTSAEVLIGWLADSADGTQLAWSDSPSAWRSNKSPETFDVTWDDGQKTVGSTTWPHTALVHVSGLSEGKVTHFRARRYVETDAGTQYGSWWPTLASDPIAVTPGTQATQVTLTAPQVVARGSSVELTWTYDTDTSQAGWQVVTGDVTENTDYETDDHGTTYSERTRPTINAADRIVVASGTDEGGSCRIDAERIESLLDGDGKVPLAVRVSTGGEWVESDAIYVTVADRPTLEVSRATLTAQPCTISLVCSTADADVSMTVRAQGVQGDSPTGTVTQPRGETVWSGIMGDELACAAVYAEDAQEGDPPVGYECTVTLPTGLDFRDGGSYDVDATATDRSTGLSSEVATCEFSVDWWRKAIMPEVTVTPHDTTDADSGVRTLGCEVATAYPTGSPATPADTTHLSADDRCDVYRLTRDGATLVASDVPVGDDVTDPFAPYGDGAELAYRVAIRTTDGSVVWDDFAYVLGGGFLRVDFGGSYVELPYNLSFDASYEKPFEQRRKMDGSIDGYWTDGVQRKSGLSTDLIKVGDEDTARRVVALARHVGPCLVRTPEGSCWCADVQLTDLSREYDSGLVAVALDATEVGLTADYMAQTEIPDQPTQS